MYNIKKQNTLLDKKKTSTDHFSDGSVLVS